MIWKYNQIQTLLDLELLCESTPQTNRHRHNILLFAPPSLEVHRCKCRLHPQGPETESSHHGNPFPPSFCISLPGHFYHCSFCKIIFLANSSPKSFGTSVGTRCSDVQRLFRSNYINKSNSLKESFYIMSKDDLPGSSEPLTLLLPQNRGFHTGKLFSLSF